ncbi:hypothetical protein C2845_PM04G16230 [Panicum miliaceum]|uniref:Activating molecule in BECN1-regulated autophagy protein 1-like n=1 Tax=Panicum miliaceum TaxID=4540 RepID=A0A3L6QSX9_PANMI|nr:hypothetical protein C2845_PM04G16230 [Panicum miliaceum]
MTESWVQDLKHASAPESVSTHEASTARRSRQRAESQSLHCWCAKYCPLLPASRATIAAAFSPDGRVRFHPLHSDILASGSLDCEVRLWDAKTSRCTRVLGFYRPIASIAFDATGELLAVASGHKLFIWDYNKRGEALDPPMILRTRRSLRAVQFHPHGAPYLLTAEVHNHDSEESTMTPALLNNYAFRDIPLLGSSGVDNLIGELPYTHNFGHVGASSSVPVNAGSFDGSRQHGTPHHQLMTSVPRVGGSLLGTHAVSFGVGSERATSLLDSGTELPCTVKLRIWRHDIKDPFIALEPGACLLTIPHVVLCRFGTVLASRAVKAAHCLTSVQFSPTSEHILLAYGRHHNSLLKTILIDGETRVPLYRVLEVYRVSDMELVRVLPSVGDEVNVACFHPSPGAGLVYGTKKGELSRFRLSPTRSLVTIRRFNFPQLYE